MAQPPTERTRVRRLPERGAYDRETIDAILDEALICHLAYVLDDGPRITPTIEVTLLDGLVIARSAFHHSMNYRSVVMYGRAREVTDPAEKWEAQRALVEHVVHGRATDARMPNDRELNQTTILAVTLDEASAKVRTGPPKDEEEDLALPIWAGVLPLRTIPGEPDPDGHLAPDLDVPPYIRDYRR